MATLSVPAERIVVDFTPRMTAWGFERQGSAGKYLRRVSYGVQEYVVGFDGRGVDAQQPAAFFVHLPPIEKFLKQALGVTCPWVAGATLLNARAAEWKYLVNEDRFAAMTPRERAGYATEVIFAADRIAGAIEFLTRGFTQHAAPFFAGVTSRADLLLRFRQARRHCETRWLPPLPAMRVYLELVLSRLFRFRIPNCVPRCRRWRPTRVVR
jgi:hypothetical protein